MRNSRFNVSRLKCQINRTKTPLQMATGGREFRGMAQMEGRVEGRVVSRVMGHPG